MAEVKYIDEGVLSFFNGLYEPADESEAEFARLRHPDGTVELLLVKPERRGEERADFHLPGQHDQESHAGTGRSPAEEAKELADVARKASGDADFLVGVTPTSADEAKELGSELEGRHVYLDVLARSSEAPKGTGMRALQAMLSLSDRWGLHVLVSAQDEGSGKLYSFYEAAGFRHVGSSNFHMMLRPAGGQFPEDQP